MQISTSGKRNIVFLGIALGATSGAVSLAQAPRVYTEPMTHADISPEWYAYSSLVALAHFEDTSPGMGLGLMYQDYGITEDDAVALFEVVRKANAEAAKSPLTPHSICDADISSPQDYVDWWKGFDEERFAYRRTVVEAFVSAADASIWETILERVYVEWLQRETFGAKVNYDIQVDMFDYRGLLHEICG